MRHWGPAFFREPIFTPGMPEAVAKAPAETAFLAKALRLKRGKRALDVCCGVGRHALLLARRGIQVTGVDITKNYLAQARKRSSGVRALTLLRGDMRNMKFNGEFDAAYNVWTSFGYSSAADDFKTLRAVSRALKPGGLFLIDLIDHRWLKKNYQQKDWVALGDGAYRVEERRMSARTMTTDWTILRRGQAPCHARFVLQLYDERRLSALLRRAGLDPVRRYHGLGNHSDRQLVLLARKKR